MKQILLLSAALFFGASLLAQHVNWAINVSQPNMNMGLSTDNSSNVYLYTYSKHWYAPDENEGTYITKYDSNGGKVSDIHWKGSVYLTSLLSDGNGSFYFTGFFQGTVNSSGFNLVSNG